MENYARMWCRALAVEWPRVRDLYEQRGVVRGALALLQVIFWATVLSVMIVAWVTADVFRFLWSHMYPLSKANLRKREQLRKDTSLQQLLNRSQTEPISAEAVHPQNEQGSENPRLSIFSRLPAEIRRQILTAAFGNVTLHMDLQFRHPYHLRHRSPYLNLGPDSQYDSHAWIQGATPDGVHLDVKSAEGKNWEWFGCVCHRDSPERANLLPLGRRGNHTWVEYGEPESDSCLCGVGMCPRWPGRYPLKCQIGIMGWMLSCKRAYFEAIDVLYGARTIHISSSVLHKNMSALFPSYLLARISSLELVWQADETPLREGFLPMDNSSGGTGPLFPRLVHLRLAFKRLTIHEVDPVTDLVWPYDNKRLLSERLHGVVLLQVDELVNRIAPPSAEVTLSCAKWDWYELIDMSLLEKQGKEATKMQQAEIRGLKCWRVIPKSTTGSSTDVEAATPSEGREGYWIHMPFDEVRLTRAYGYDWERDELYGLNQQWRRQHRLTGH
ncbi:hypothetical protein QQS21_012172 [Conoideocrella luteorostrata]|uniref:DUF7730 domain-containing protein n=1 Tax=Conoideocrella luteorostrata TaxID=1105319 RepID=A0AAJ0FSY3_9HYPO|nr:hypothetical protein QQS21_012172 [Conoideocrella luteorostrata]